MARLGVTAPLERSMLARVVTVLVLLGAPLPAFALEACFAGSLGPWRGPVWNGRSLQVMETEYEPGPDGTLVGHYRIHDDIPFDGTLSDFRRIGDCEAEFTWTDRDGTGLVHIRFEPQLGRFIGSWGRAEPEPSLVFNGYRIGPNVTS
jgi:hypothetical protein